MDCMNAGGVTADFGADSTAGGICGQLRKIPESPLIMTSLNIGRVSSSGRVGGVIGDVNLAKAYCLNTYYLDSECEFAYSSIKDETTAKNFDAICSDEVLSKLNNGRKVWSMNKEDEGYLFPSQNVLTFEKEEEIKSPVKPIAENMQDAG